MKNVSITKAVKIKNQRVKSFDGEKEYLATGGLIKDKIKTETIKYNTKPSRADLLVSKNQLIVARMKGTNKVLLIDKNSSDLIVSTGFLVLEVQEGWHPRFLFHYFVSTHFQDQKDKLSIGATQKAINNTKFKEILIPELSFEDQKRIVKILDEADRLRQKRKQAMGLLDDYLKSVFLEMFGDPITNSKKWSLVKFTDIIVMRRGFDLPKQDRVAGDFPLVASNGIVDRISLSKVNGPGVVTGRSGTLGSVQLIEEDYWPLNTSLYSQKLNGNNPVYLKFFLDYFDLKRFTRGAGVPTLNRNLFHSELVPKVPVELQNKFETIYRKYTLLKRTMLIQLTDLEILFQSLIQKAFKGGL